MDIAIVGLGKMGANMARRLIKGGHRVVGFNRSFDVTKKTGGRGRSCCG